MLITKDNCGLMVSAETKNYIRISVNCAYCSGDTQSCFTQWLKLPDGGYVVYRELEKHWDYEGSECDSSEMFIQVAKPTFAECEAALLDYLNREILE